jgi:hypothetical protein
MNLAANALGLATVLWLASAVCPQDHTVSPHISHDAPLPDLISPNFTHSVAAGHTAHSRPAH